MNSEKRDHAEKHDDEHVRESDPNYQLRKQALSDLLHAKLAYEAAEREPNPIRRYYRKNEAAAAYVGAWDRITGYGYAPVWDQETGQYHAVAANHGVEETTQSLPPDYAYTFDVDSGLVGLVFKGHRVVHNTVPLAFSSEETASKWAWRQRQKEQSK